MKLHDNSAVLHYVMFAFVLLFFFVLKEGGGGGRGEVERV